jgi:hypothetical protein
VAMLPPTIFFFITLQLVAVIRVLMLKGTGIAVGSPFQVLIAALIADLMPFINLYPHKPLIYNVVWKTAIYLLIATLIHYTERLLEFWKAAGSFGETACRDRVAALLGRGNPPPRIDFFL